MQKLINRILEDGNPEQIDYMVELIANLVTARNSGDSERTKLIDFICDFFSREDKGFELQYLDRKIHVYLTDDDNNTNTESFELGDADDLLAFFDDFIEVGDE